MNVNTNKYYLRKLYAERGGREMNEPNCGKIVRKKIGEKQGENVENILMLKYYNFNWYFRVIPLAQTLPIIHPR